MRAYNHDNSTSPLTLESPAQPSSVINLPLYPPTHHTALFNPTPAYSPDSGGSFYPPAASNVFPHIDARSRLGSSTSTTGMAHALRSTALPHPAAYLNTRDVYSPSTPAFRRSQDHTPRSPSFPGIRRLPISPTPSPNLGFTAPGPSHVPFRMDVSYSSSKAQQNIPPLQPLVLHGTLSYNDAPNVPVKPEIHGAIEKGFFLADNEWTCYRRNYFTCVCSYNISSPTFSHSTLHYTQSPGSQSYQVYGFAMCISAVVADNDQHSIELVQHTPKRDKGPIAPPEKVRLAPKPPQTAHHPLGHYAQSDLGLAGSSRAYDQSGYGQQQQQGSFPTEHTFERIQFKQATANNGKRRAAQQYYHLVFELFADVGVQQGGGDQFLKVAYRKSAKMIVRGRSPGHYQSERRASTSSGPGGSAGSMGYSGSQMMGGEYGGPGAPILGGGGYSQSSYDTRSSGHYRTHDHLPMEPILSSEQAKDINEPAEYKYFPGPVIENNHDPRAPVEMYSHHNHHQSRPQENTLRQIATGLDVHSKMKNESYEGGLPSMLFPGSSFYDRSSCGRYESKSSSSGFYPTMMPPPTSGMNMT